MNGKIKFLSNKRFFKKTGFYSYIFNFLLMKKQIIKILKSLGHNDIDLRYHKSEGWWLTSNLFDDWLSMDIYGAFLRVKKHEVMIKIAKNTKHKL